MGRRVPSVPGVWSLVGQMFLLQVIVVVLLVAAAVVALVLQARDESTWGAHNRSLAVAEVFANSPGIEEALRSGDPTAVLQPGSRRPARGRSPSRPTGDGPRHVPTGSCTDSTSPSLSSTARARSMVLRLTPWALMSFV